MNREWSLILDFDSTIITAESLDILSEISLDKNKNKKSVISKIKYLTNLGMEGEISFQESIQKRISLLEANKSHIRTLSENLIDFISPSFLKNKEWISKYNESIYVISGGFRDTLLKTCNELNIKSGNIFGNSFQYDSFDYICGIDNNNYLSKTNGKVHQIQALGINNKIIAVGDGKTDAEIKNIGENVTFLGYTENIARTYVVDNCDMVVKSFDDVIDFMENQQLI